MGVRSAVRRALFVASAASLALGLVLTCRTSGVVNFAHAAMGTYVAFSYYEFRDQGNLVLPVIGAPARIHLLRTPTQAISVGERTL